MDKKQVKTNQKKKSNKKMTDKSVRVGRKMTFPRKCHFTNTALEFDSDISLEEFCKVSDFLISHYSWIRNSHFKFWVGDWMNHALGSFKRRAIKTTAMSFLRQYTYGYLRNIEWVCRAIEPSRRREKLSFSHHQEVAPLPPEEQDFWMDRAEEYRLSAKELRRDIECVRSAQQGESQKDDDRWVLRGLKSESIPAMNGLLYKVRDLIKYKARLGSEDFMETIQYGKLLTSFERLLKYIIILLNGTDVLQKAQEEADKDLLACESDKEIIIGFTPLEEYKECMVALYNERFGGRKEKPKKSP